MENDEKKLRILCIHGYMQNEFIFSESLTKLTNALKNMVEFYFISGPTIIPKKKNNDKNDDEKEQSMSIVINYKLK